MNNPISVDNAIDILQPQISVAAFAFCKEFTKDSNIFLSDNLIAIHSKASVFYPSLPSCVQVYSIKDTSSFDVHEFKKENAIVDDLFIFAPNGVVVTNESRNIQPVETYIRYVLSESNESMICDDIVILDTNDYQDLLNLYAETDQVRFGHHTFDSGIYVGLKANGNLIGAYGTHFINRDYGIAMTGFLAISKKYRNRGLSNLLVNNLSHYLKANYSTVVCDISAFNTPSIKAHENAGFISTGTVCSAYLVKGNDNASAFSQ